MAEIQSQFICFFVSWKANLQLIMVSSTEVKFVAATKAVKESKWLNAIMNELSLQQKTSNIFCDNQIKIHLIRNQVYHETTKHIDVKFYFIRDDEAKRLQ